MGAIPVRRETGSRPSDPSDAPAHGGARPRAQARVTLPGNPLAPGAARAFVRARVAEWIGLGLPGSEHLTGRLIADALVVTSELVTNAVVHAGTDVELACRTEESGAFVVEVSDRHPSRAPHGGAAELPHGPTEYGRGLHLVARLADSWGVTYRTGAKTVWARLPAGGGGDAGGGGGCGAEGGEWCGGEGGRACAAAGGEGCAAGCGRAWAGAGGEACVAAGGEGCGQAGAVEGAEGAEGTKACAAAGGEGCVAGCDRACAAEGGEECGADGGQAFAAGCGKARATEGREACATEGRKARATERREACATERREAHAAQPAAPRPLAIPHPAPLRPERDREWLNRGALSFLAEASDLLAGQLDENLVAALAGQLLVPRLADWCAVWLEDETSRWGSARPTGAGALGDPGGAGPHLARVWHGSETRIEELRRALEKDPPRPTDDLRSGPVAHPWPGRALGPYEAQGTALAYRLVAGGRPLGTLVIGRAGLLGFPDEVTGLVEDLGRRVALAIGAARQYARQATISAVLQRGLLPGAVAEIPGLSSALVYEPCDKGGPSGDFYDLFPAGDGRWCFAVGDVQGKGPEAAVVIGLARPWLRLLAREGYRVADVLDRLNQLLLDETTEAADAAARALAGPTAPGDGPQTRFLSLLYGELVPFPGGVRCTLASAGHPLPLLLGHDGSVRTAARPQTLLGVVEDATYTSETFELLCGDSLLCVTDGVTERRSGSRQFDDGDGLATALAGCAGLTAPLIAERIRRLVHEFDGRPPADDLALLVLQAE
ncbi:SpoIIE family protein phosphatase [Streptomyces sp. TRM68416]|uniref:SpoIIE family protein phosphatase n=1 Tax=Streptomyces sp. TRM68416 TaxID=2758412 RepID=UPI001662040F|nr:SpoIIE family protein phosphatase [Streptomyces sp. TRM68416]MBD0837614.1 SpoIIE family protein phosphatase [Streptomyces sp. TRM68416]